MNQTQQHEPIGGLWAFVNNRVFILELKGQNQKMDHVQWFRHLGLPDFGPGFDQILRGRMLWDWHFNCWKLSYTGHVLPNRVYSELNNHFNKTGAHIQEKQTSFSWY